jgi:hypothetical protein
MSRICTSSPLLRHHRCVVGLLYLYLSLLKSTLLYLLVLVLAIADMSPHTILKLCLRSEDAFVITCVTNLMEVKVLYVLQDLRHEISSYWPFNV